ncbi:CCHC-type domain-containing protein [Trichonephila clavipes]|nr:CCHC-type domain-containing protein [Trichonephila clavipes]
MKEDISLYLILFERQACMMNVPKEFWVSHLLRLLPQEIPQLIAREPEQEARDYDHASKRRTGCILTDETDLVSLIRTIVREEVHRLVNQTQESLDSDPQSLEEIVQDEVERVLAPVSTKPTETRPRPTYAAVTRKYRAPVQKFPPEPRKTDVWRTADNRPVCFHCGRPGHVMRYCRERKAVFDNSRNRRRNFDDVGTEEKYADQTLLAVLRQVHERPIPNTSLQIPVAISPIHHDVILGWDFFRASQAVIDCGQNELVLEDICRDSTAPDAWNLYATRDYTHLSHIL